MRSSGSRKAAPILQMSFSRLRGGREAVAEGRGYALVGVSRMAQPTVSTVINGESRPQITRSTSIALISPIAWAGFNPLGHTWAQFMIVWQR